MSNCGETGFFIASVENETGYILQVNGIPLLLYQIYKPGDNQITISCTLDINRWTQLQYLGQPSAAMEFTSCISKMLRPKDNSFIAALARIDNLKNQKEYQPYDRINGRIISHVNTYNMMKNTNLPSIPIEQIEHINIKSNDQSSGILPKLTESIPKKTKTIKRKNKLKRQIGKLQDQIDNHKCIICQSTDRNILFDDCNHIVCCNECSSNIGDNCIICNKFIKRKIKVFFSYFFFTLSCFSYL
jgi:hypothetical protein